MATLAKRINWIMVLTLLSLVTLIVMTGVPLRGLASNGVTFLFLAIAIMASVHHAEDIAHAIGEGLGTLVLALSVTVIEVGLIVSLMSSGGSEGSAVARDTVFAAVMLICNGIVGICLLLGGLKYKEVGFHFRGSSTLLGVVICLSVMCFVLPNFTTSVAGPYYNSKQLIFVSIVSIILYVALVYFQTKTHQSYFQSDLDEIAGRITKEEKKIPIQKVVISMVALVIGLVSVIGLAKLLAPAIEQGVTALGAPKAVVGLLIATIVLLPEAITAVFAARENRLQTSLNLALGSGAASIALTIPVVSVYSIIQNQPLLLGLDPKGTVFLILTFIIGALTLGNGKATALHGVVHLIILAAFFAVTLVP